MPSMREYNQNSVIEIFDAADFYPVSYDKDTRLATVGTTAINKSAASVMIKDEAKVFTSSPADKRSLKYGVSDWRFTLYLKFAQEVTLEGFEDDLLQGIRAGEEQGFSDKLMIFMPVSADIAQPTNDGASGAGTEARYILSNVLSKE
ncbi:MAG: hypothetical protein GY845_25585 [Planctomycetes bacterium]|nr:hypothetical protein [Planctomycetota bacterium]